MREAPTAKHLEPLQKMLQEKLLSVKFLLILDDVWEEEKTSEWEKLFAPLRTGKSGSKILLTTRMASVAELAAKAMGVKKNLLTLERLKEDQSLELFNHHVFSGLNSHEYEQLKVIGEQIARKLGGCPLVTKVASGHLQGNMTFEYWNNFLHKGLEHFKGTREDILSVLRLSYYHLPTELQICLRYCSLFPEDYEFKKEKLVQLWMGSRLISCPGRDSLTFEEIGEQRLARLTKKSFFDLHLRVSYNGAREEYYVMHDLIHALAVHVSFGECAMINGPARLQAEKDTVRHIHIPDIDRISVEDVKQMSRFKNLRSIIINFGCYPNVDQNIVSAFGRVVESSKTLRLFYSGLLHTSHFDDKLCNLKHLRYIWFSQLSPEGICGVIKLYHLMLLHCYCLNTNMKQVRYVGNLDNLRYVSYGVNSVGLNQFPVSRLTHLRKLNNYWIGGSMGHKISAIGNLRDLHELELQNLQNVKDHDEAVSAKLNEKKHLKSLSLRWSNCCDSDAHAQNDELVLSHLQPHGNIQVLQISGYSGLRFPFWMENPSVKKLVSLKLENCKNCKHLPFVEELLWLKYLVLEGLPKLRLIGQSSHKSGTSSMELLSPCLYKLEVRNCPKLRKLPIIPPSLMALSIKYVGLTTLLFSEPKASRLWNIKIIDCPNLTSLEGSLPEQKLLLGMGSVNFLTIRNCRNLKYASIPFGKMSGLRELDISGCPKLRIMRNSGDRLLPSSFMSLTMGVCGDLELPLLGSLQGLTDLYKLVLCNCPGLVSLPSADVFKSLTSLQRVLIEKCENLSSLGGLRSLEMLDIRQCSKLVETPDASDGEGHMLHIKQLRIDLPSLLLVEPLKSLCHTNCVVISDGSEMEGLPERWLLQNRASLESLSICNANSLESLPSSIRDLSGLGQLTIRGAPLLHSLPDLPSSLQKLSISGCDSYQNMLKERNKFSHIPRVEIGGSYFIMDKKCSRKTYDEFRNEHDNSILASWVEQQNSYKGMLKRMLRGCSSTMTSVF